MCLLQDLVQSCLRVGGGWTAPLGDVERAKSVHLVEKLCSFFLLDIQKHSWRANGQGTAGDGGVCCLLVLDSVTFAPQCIRQPRPRVYLKEGTYHTRLFGGPSTNGMKKWDGPSRSWPTPHATPLFLPPEDPSPVLLRPNSIPG